MADTTFTINPVGEFWSKNEARLLGFARKAVSIILQANNVSFDSINDTSRPPWYDIIRRNKSDATPWVVTAFNSSVDIVTVLTEQSIQEIAIELRNAEIVTLAITVESGVRFIDGAGWPNCGDVESQGARISTLVTNTNNVNIEWLEGTGAITVSTSSDDVRIDHCMIHEDGISCNAGTLVVNSCFVYNASDWGIRRTSGTLNIYNCTVFNCVGIGITNASGVVYNCISLSNATDYSVSATADFNMSRDATAPGTTTWQSVTASDIITDTTASTEDLHLISKFVGYTDASTPSDTQTIEPSGSTTPGGEGVDKAIDNNFTNKYSNNDKLFCGFEITLGSAGVVKVLR